MKSTEPQRLDVTLGRSPATLFGGPGYRAPRIASTLSRSHLSRAIEFINANIGRDLRLSEIAQIVGMSPHHFAHAFKNTTGVAPHQYLIARRIARAKSLLLETDLPMGEIAYQVGYSNQAHFSTVFHRLAAMTPRTFRRSADARLPAHSRDGAAARQ